MDGESTGGAGSMFDDLDLSLVWRVLPYVIGVVTCLGALLIGAAALRRGKRAAVVSEEPGHPLPPAPSASDARVAIRRSETSVPILILDPNDPDRPRNGFVVNRSLGGLGLALDDPVNVGTRLRLRPCDAPETTVWVEVEVRGCRRQGRSWEIGCQYVVMPSYNVMMLFG
jgi:hypothetical protein